MISRIRIRAFQIRRLVIYGHSRHVMPDVSSIRASMTGIQFATVQPDQLDRIVTFGTDRVQPPMPALRNHERLHALGLHEIILLTDGNGPAFPDTGLEHIHTTPPMEPISVPIVTPYDIEEMVPAPLVSPGYLQPPFRWQRWYRPLALGERQCGQHGRQSDAELTIALAHEEHVVLRAVVAVHEKTSAIGKLRTRTGPIIVVQLFP